MIYLAIILVIILYIFSLSFRLFISSPIKFISLFIKDTYVNYKRYRFIPNQPFMNIYCGLFGQGKTLSAVHDCIEFYQTYNDKKVYDDRFHKFVTQKVMVLSNVDLKTIPYKKFRSFQQLIDISKYRKILDYINNVRTVTVVLFDESSTQVNSREYRTFPIPVLNVLLTSRHYNIQGFYLTSQRFGHTDALIRQICTYVIQCSKSWRIVKNVYYDAWEYENAARPSDVAAVKITGFLALDKDYAAYDTLAVVDNIIKDVESGKMLSDKEILESRGSKTVVLNEQGKKKRKKGKIRNK